jgi:hypothetical protein
LRRVGKRSPDRPARGGVKARVRKQFRVGTLACVGRVSSGQQKSLSPRNALLRIPGRKA